MSLRVAWVYRAERNIVSSPRFADDLVLVTGRDHHLRALERAGGRERWAVALDRGTSASPTVAGAFVYVADEAGAVHKIGLVDGTTTWKTTLDVGIAANPVVWGGLVLVNAGATRPGLPGGGLRALDAASGALVWAIDSPSGARSTPVVAGECAVTVDHEGAILAVHADGSLRWRLERNTPVYGELCAVGSSAVAIPMGSGEVLVLDVRTGDVLWFFDTGKAMLRGGVAATEHTVFAGAADGRVYAFEHPGGKVRWTLEERSAREWVSWSAPIIVEDRLIALSSGDVSKLVVLSAPDGSRLDELQVEGVGDATPAYSDGDLAITTTTNLPSVQLIVTD